MSISNNGNPGANLPNMQNHAEDSMFYRFRDIELLRTGSYSDALVIAGTREWKVHKNIVCTRSGFMGEKEAVHKIRHHTEKQVDLVLEFIYSGSIAAIVDFSLADCVELSILGVDFLVCGMVEYAKKNLWDKLTLILGSIVTIPINNDAHQDPMSIRGQLNGLNFLGPFTNAVDKAYEGHGGHTQVVIADFVWAARGWLLHHPSIEALNKRHPTFGSHVMTTLTQGPQSSFIQDDGQFAPVANTTARFLCFNDTRAHVQRPNQAMQLSFPRSL